MNAQRELLYRALSDFTPWNEQEQADVPILLQALESEEPVLERRDLIRHFTASAWVLNRERTKVLMAWHNIYRSWAWLGGHADGNADLLSVALSEAREESGLTDVRPLTEGPVSVEILTVNGHVKRGSYVPCHLHLNVTYLLEADEAAPLRVREDENSAVGWLTPEEAVARSTEPWIREHIYEKLNARTRSLGYLK